MRRKISDEERRSRLGRRHALANECKVSTARAVASAVVAIHGTDPSSTVLGILARSRGLTIPDVEETIYTERTLVRVLAMRRTLFAVDYIIAPSIWVAFDNTVARNQRRLLEKLVQESGVSTDPASWIRIAENRLLEIIDANPGRTGAQLAAEDELVAQRVKVGGSSIYATEVSVASRLLTLLSAEGRVIRGRPVGSWTSTQFTWSATEQWRDDWPKRPEHSADADLEIAASWLEQFGPALIDDFSWWTGWPKGRTRKAFAAAGAVQVELDAGEGWVLASDVEPTEAPEPWVALLPGLDSTTMGWKQRGFYLGPHAARLFDDVGNAGPTVWVDGRIVGGWTQLDEGPVVYELFEELGRDRHIELDREAARLTALLAEARLKPRARRWTESERALRARHSKTVE
ncbi:MAG TPA: winged helix DNA-binding domain-containing protein [Thermomicrobiales bacterium]|nr:winged helix DNA-binding domain-containing protein [Thermomicrobiales bacterium]